MLIIVYGEDSFRVREKIRELERRFKGKFDQSGINMERFFSDAPIGEIMTAVQSPPFLAEKRLIVIRDLFTASKKAQSEDWSSALKKIPLRARARRGSSPLPPIAMCKAQLRSLS